MTRVQLHVGIEQILSILKHLSSNQLRFYFYQKKIHTKGGKMFRGLSCNAYYKCSNCDRKYTKILDSDRSLNYCIRCHAANYPYEKVICAENWFDQHFLIDFLCLDIIFYRSTSSLRELRYAFQIGAIENISKYHSNQKYNFFLFQLKWIEWNKKLSQLKG